jgi:hypothetical protein
MTFVTQSAPVTRVTHEFTFQGAKSVTFYGSRTPNGPVEAFAINKPKRGFNCKDGSVSITNRSGNWGWEPDVSGPSYRKVWGFQPGEVVQADGTRTTWVHKG